MSLHGNLYDNWTKEALIQRIRQLESANSCVALQRTEKYDSKHPNQSVSTVESIESAHVLSRRRRSKEIDFSRYTKRPIALKIAYLGWEYYGFASQDSAMPSVELHLFEALARAKLIDQDMDRRQINYSRCGRTDKGVSSFGQVVNLYVRSHLKPGGSVIPWDVSVGERVQGEEDVETQEISYMDTLNRLLPEDIRVLAWSPCQPEFSARFDCAFRRYRYYFHPLDLNLEKMKIAAKYLEGERDYRNFAKVDMNKVEQSYTRTIYSAQFVQLGEVIAFEIKGSSFLWHMVRNVMSVLFAVGQGLEEPEVVLHLMDMSKQPLDKSGQPAGKPNYDMADDKPLVLVECGYKGGVLDWQPSETTASGVRQHEALMDGLWEIWSRFDVRVVELADLMSRLHAHGRVPKVKKDKCAFARGKYIPLMERSRADSAADRWERRAYRV
jgi:tRNA pseudouridine38/39 synthase